MMLRRSFDRKTPLVADTSVVINLNATGRAAEILRAIPSQFFVTDVVVSELEDGHRPGRRDFELLTNLVKARHIEVVSVNGAGLRVFEDLVVGRAIDTLDDGEAATIAYAIEHGFIPVIDERKANRICAERFERLKPATTIDLLAQSSMVTALGEDGLSEAVFQALRQGRMQVLPHQIDLVVSLIGAERASLCPSLPRAVREASSASQTPRHRR